MAPDRKLRYAKQTIKRVEDKRTSDKIQRIAQRRAMHMVLSKDHVEVGQAQEGLAKVLRAQLAYAL